MFDPSKVHLAVFYRNFQAKNSVSYKHVGLGVNAMHTARVLKEHGIDVGVYGIWDGHDIRRQLNKLPQTTHAVIEAPFIGGADMRILIKQFPGVQFVCRTHSQISFLQVEAGAIRMLREYITLQDAELNFRVATNSDRLTDFVNMAWKGKSLYLPNLYGIDRGDVHCRPKHRQTLRISSFGAIRLLKNHTGAAAAALLIAKGLQRDLEFYINSEREEHGKGVKDALTNMFRDLTWAKIVEVPWQDWPEFRHTVASMDLCLQPSFTETFCLVLADAASQGVPCVGSPAISWLPTTLQPNPDDVEEIARVGIKALKDPEGHGRRAFKALDRHVVHATKLWKEFLSS